MTDLQEFIGYTTGFVWGPVMRVFLVGTGVRPTRKHFNEGELRS